MAPRSPHVFLNSFSDGGHNLIDEMIIAAIIFGLLLMWLLRYLA